MKVVYHQPPKIDHPHFDGDPNPSSSYTELTVIGRSYKLAGYIDNRFKGFLKTPDGDAIVFIEGDHNQSIMNGLLHIVNLRAKSDTALPMGLHWIGFDPHMYVVSYNGHRLILFVDSQSDSDPSGNLEIDLDAKKVVKFERLTNSIPTK